MSASGRSWTARKASPSRETAKAGRFRFDRAQGLGRTLQLKQPRDGRAQSTSGSRRTRGRASETARVARPPAKLDSIGMRCRQGDWSRQARLDGCPGGQRSRMERREANRPPRYNHLRLGGPVRAWQSAISSIQGKTATTAARSRALKQLSTTAQTTLKPALAITLQQHAIAPGCLAITVQLGLTAEAQRPRLRSRSTTTLPVASSSSRKP